MPRRILHHGSDPAGAGESISERAIAGCWFEWHRQGGCGAGEVRLRDDFAHRNRVQPGDWISIESEPGVRWYLGRVETREATYPAGVRFRLEGMGVELGEVYPGGFGVDIDGAAPQRFGATDRFSYDPDRGAETFDAVGDAASAVRLLMSRYVAPVSHIVYNPVRVEDAARPAGVESLKVRGEETARALIKELAIRAGSAAWGVDAAGEFFFLQRRTAIDLTLQIGQNIAELEEIADRGLLFNRLLLTGDYIYDRAEATDNIALRSYRWRGNYVEPASRSVHGERRLRLWIPWIRTQADAFSFAREFFRTYSQPRRRHRVLTGEVVAPAFPWLGAVRLQNAAGFEIATGLCDIIRVRFDRAPRLELEIGPEDPRQLWPEPAQDERWELPAHPEVRGGELSITTLTDPWTDDDGGGSGLTDSDSTATVNDSSLSEAGSSSSGFSEWSDGSDGSDDLTSVETSGDDASHTSDDASDDRSDSGGSFDSEPESSSGSLSDADSSGDSSADDSGSGSDSASDGSPSATSTDDLTGDSWDSSDSSSASTSADSGSELLAS